MTDPAIPMERVMTVVGGSSYWITRMNRVMTVKNEPGDDKRDEACDDDGMKQVILWLWITRMNRVMKVKNEPGDDNGKNHRQWRSKNIINRAGSKNGEKLRAQVGPFLNGSDREMPVAQQDGCPEYPQPQQQQRPVIETGQHIGRGIPEMLKC